MNRSQHFHEPIMVEKVLEAFSGIDLTYFYEGTLGSAGHAYHILSEHPEIKRYIGCDKDPSALEIARKKLDPWKDKLELIHGDFADLDQQLVWKKIENIDGFFFDLGVSSMQLNQGEKGFSFLQEGPLDMRMNPESSLTAFEIVNHWSEEKLGEIFKEYGEEKRWKKAAHAIAQARKRSAIETTKQLADLLRDKLGRGIKKRLHPATLIFQALRICVNRELESIRQALPKAIDILRVGGRLGVMSFHSLEDRIVKEIFKEGAFKKAQNKYRGFRERPVLKLVTKKPLVAGKTEVRANPRSRSARLRIVEKVARG